MQFWAALEEQLERLAVQVGHMGGGHLAEQVLLPSSASRGTFPAWAGSMHAQDIGNVCWACCRLELMPPWVSGAMSSFLPTVLTCMETTVSSGGTLSGGGQPGAGFRFRF